MAIQCPLFFLEKRQRRNNPVQVRPRIARIANATSQ